VVNFQVESLPDCLTTHIPGDSRSLDFSKEGKLTGLSFHSPEVLCHATQKVRLFCPERDCREKYKPGATAAKAENKTIFPTMTFSRNCETSSGYPSPGRMRENIHRQNTCVVF